MTEAIPSRLSFLTTLKHQPSRQLEPSRRNLRRKARFKVAKRNCDDEATVLFKNKCQCDQESFVGR